MRAILDSSGSVTTDIFAGLMLAHHHMSMKIQITLVIFISNGLQECTSGVKPSSIPSKSTPLSPFYRATRPIETKGGMHVLGWQIEGDFKSEKMPVPFSSFLGVNITATRGSGRNDKCYKPNRRFGRKHKRPTARERKRSTKSAVIPIGFQ
jgi:hypothetical protein